MKLKEFVGVFLGVWVILGGFSQQAQAEVTTSDVITFVKEAWGLADAADEVLTGELAGTYEGTMTVSEVITVALIAFEIEAKILEGDLKGAFEATVEGGLDLSLAALAKQAGLSGVVAWATLGTLPIKWSLYSLYNTVQKKNFERQIKLYNALRELNSAEEIRDLEPADVIDGQDDVIATKDDQGWLRYGGFFVLWNVGPVAGMTPEQFFELAEAKWTAERSSAELRRDFDKLREHLVRRVTGDAPMFVTNLSDITLSDDSEFEFMVEVSGTPPFRFRWYYNGQPYAGLDEDGEFSYFPSQGPGEYRVEASNDLGTVPSNTVTLTLAPAGNPTAAITSPSNGQTVAGVVPLRGYAPSATRVVFLVNGTSVGSDSTKPFNLNWDTAQATEGAHTIEMKAYDGDTLLADAAVVSVTVGNASAPVVDSPDAYEPNNSSGSATYLNDGSSLDATISSPQDVDWFTTTIAETGTLTFSVSVPNGADFDLEAYGPDGIYIGGSYRPEGLTESVTLASVSPGTYLVRVYGYPVGNGSFDPVAPYSISLSYQADALGFASPISDLVTFEGGSAVFGVSPSGLPPFGFQWYDSRGNPITAGASGPQLVLNSVNLADDGDQYRVEITDRDGTVISSEFATLNVIDTSNALTWTGSVSSDWSDPLNWSPEDVPGENSMIRLESGSLNLPNDFELRDLIWTGGALHGNVAVTRLAEWSGGTIAGKLTVAEGATLGIVEGEEKRIAEQNNYLTNHGTLNWYGDGDAAAIRGGAYRHTGTRITNGPTGVFNILGDSYMARFGDNNYHGSGIVNEGLIRKTSPGETVMSHWSIGGGGAVEVLAGTLRIGNAAWTSSSFSGPVAVGAGASLAIEDGTSFGAGALLAVEGSVTYASGVSFDPSVAFTGGGAHAMASNASFSGSAALPGLSFESGTMTGDFTLAPGGHIVWSGGTIAGKLTVAEGATLDIVEGEEKRIAEQNNYLTNHGTLNWYGDGDAAAIRGGAYRHTGTRITNGPTGVFNILGDSYMARFGDNNYHGSGIVNEGLIRKTSPGETVMSHWSIGGGGAVEVLAGTLRIGNAAWTSSSFSGPVAVGAGASLAIEDGTSFGAGALLAVEGSVTYASGVSFDPSVAFTGGGAHAMASNASFSGSAALPGLSFESGTMTGDFTLAPGGHIVWSGGTIAGKLTVAEGATLDIVEGEEKRIAEQNNYLTNHGTLNWYGDGDAAAIRGGAYRHTGTRITNGPTGVFNILGDSYMARFGDNNYHGSGIVNEGLIRKTSPGETVMSHWSIGGGGAVEVLAGTLRIGNAAWTSSSFSGPVAVGAGASLAIEDGTSFGAGALLAVEGSVTYASGVSFDPSVAFTGGGAHAMASNASFSGSAALPGLSFESGTMTGDFTLAPGGHIVWSGGTIAGKLTVAEGATLDIVEGEEKRIAEQNNYLTNHGTLNWYGDGDAAAIRGGAYRHTGTRITNGPTGVFNILGDSYMARFGDNNYHGSGIVNEGLIRKTSPGETVMSHWSIGGGGAVEVLAGTLRIGNAAWTSSSFSGPVAVGAGASLAIEDGTSFGAGALLAVEGSVTYASGVSFDPSVAFTGGGAHAMASNASFSGSAALPGLSFESGTMTGDFTLAPGGHIVWSGGTIAGKLTVAEGATLDIVEGEEKRIAEQNNYLTNHGTLNWYGDGDAAAIRGGAYRHTGTRITNGPTGVFNILGDSYMARFGDNNYHGSGIVNEGLIRKTSPGETVMSHWSIGGGGAVEVLAGTLRIGNAAWTSSSFSGPVAVGAGASLAIEDGTSFLPGSHILLNDSSLTSTFQLSFAGRVEGSGNIDANVTNQGNFVPKGILQINGNYNQSGVGELTISVRGTQAGTDYDQLDVSGVATLAGGLSLSFPTGYMPPIGAQFEVVKHGSRTGDFTNYLGLRFSATGELIPTLGAVSVVMSSGSVDVPESFVDWLQVLIDEPAIPQESLIPSADLEFDGIPLLLEFAFGGLPQVGDLAILPQAELVEEGGQNFLTLRYRRWRDTDGTQSTGTTGVDYTIHGIRYSVQTSGDMVNWASGATIVQQIGLAEDNGDGTETVTVRVSAPIESTPRQVARVQVELVE